MQMRTIEQQDLAAAEAVLARGFLDRPRAFWGEKLQLLQDYRVRRNTGPIGYLLSVDGEDMGVLLTLESPTLRQDGTAGRKINLSSWFVDPRARLSAARMLQKATTDDVVYTDLTPSMQVRALNERLGITAVCSGSLLAPSLTDSMLPGSAAVRDFTHTTQLPAAETRLLRDHAALGLMSAVLTDGGVSLPLILMRTTCRGLPGARVIYTPSRTALRTQRGAIARYLLHHRLWFLEVESNREDCWPGTLFAPNRCAVFAKGRIDPQAIDHSYSELAFILSTRGQHDRR